MNIDTIRLEKGKIPVLDKTGEQDIIAVEIDAEIILEKYPGGVISLLVERPDGIITPLVITINYERKSVIGVLREYETAVPGILSFELRCTLGTQKKKSDIYRGKIERSLTEPGDVPPQQSDWVNKVLEGAHDVQVIIEGPGEDGYILTKTGNTAEWREYAMTEQDPTVADWAKKPNDKPTYTAEEVGALPEDTELKDIPGDTTHRTVSDEQIERWNSYPEVPTKVSELENDVGYISEEIDPTVADWAKEPTKPTYTASEVGAIPTSAKGSNGGVAELDNTGRVPSSQLPSYVDDVLEYNSREVFPVIGENGKIYVAVNTNRVYRWGGTTYVEVSPSLALGETSQTAYRGDRGKTAYDHSQSRGNPHGTTAAQIGALPADTPIPTRTSDLQNDSGFITGEELDKKADKFTYRKLKQYLYEATATGLDYNYAYNFFEHENPQVPASGCSAVRIGNFYGRNFDWQYNRQASFALHVPAHAGYFASVGIAGSVPNVLDENEDEWNTAIIPFFLQDGVNEHGLTVSTLVVPSEGNENRSVPTVSLRDSVNGIMLCRYILDRYKTVQEAITDITEHVEIWFSDFLHEMGYEQHWLIADENETYALEVVDNDICTREINALTNFLIDGVTLNDDGTVYTPATLGEGSPTTDNGITDHGSGLERWNIIAQHSTGTMQQLMDRLKYTNAYSDVGWHTEFVDGDLHCDSPVSDFTEVEATAQAEYQRRTRDNPVTWQTVHSAVYDISKRSLTVVVQEDGEDISILLDGISERVADLEETVTSQSTAIASLDSTAIKGVKVAGTELTKDGNGKVDVPIVTADGAFGVFKTSYQRGITVVGGVVSPGLLTIYPPSASTLNAKANQYQPITPSGIDLAVRAGLISNAQITDADKPTICQTIGAEKKRSLELIETITLDAPALSIVRSTTPGGNPYDYKRIVIIGSGALTGSANMFVYTNNIDVLMPANTTNTYYYIEMNYSNGLITIDSHCGAYANQLNTCASTAFVDSANTSIVSIKFESTVTLATGFTISIYGEKM